MESLQEFIAQLSKMELHVHLVGSASVATVLGLARRHPDSGVPHTAEELGRFYEFRGFAHFIDVYDALSGLVTEPEDIADLVRGDHRGARRGTAGSTARSQEDRPEFGIRHMPRRTG
jgi:aminodeoxyfutalosine deaminase